jgi:MFS family permease
MTKAQQFIYSANSFSSGILIPVLSLVLLDKGSNLQTLPLMLSLYSLTVLCLELPSGIFADIYGRKAAFLVSCVFLLISFSLLIAANNIFFLVPAIVFFGLGRAFSSGSLDALIIDQSLEANGEEYLAKVTSRLAILESAGLASGSIIGGWMYNLTGTYAVNIIARLALTAMVTVLCIIFIKDAPQDNRQKQRTSLNEIIGQGKQAILEKPEFSLIFIGVFFTGFFLFTIETYWQPAFMRIVPTGHAWMLGFLSFIAYFTVILGNTSLQKLLSRYQLSWWNAYSICRFLMAAFILVFAFQVRELGFICWYAGIYFALGAANQSESFLVNKYTPNNMRASILSLSSLMTQVGGLCGSLFSSIAIITLQFSGIWAVAAGLSGAYAIAAAAAIYKIGKKNSAEHGIIEPHDP